MTTPSRPRFHHLDALRAAAMLLGIVLHALLSFVELPLWPAQDLHQNTRAYGFLQHAIHGFRMPLFFLISGFFTTMLWRKRGLRQLVLHRLKRILLPLLVGWIAFVPLTVVLSILGERMKKEDAQIARASPSTDGELRFDLWSAAQRNDPEALLDQLARGADPNQPDHLGIPPLHWAALLGHLGAADVLLDSGADVNGRDSNGASALHAAAFLGRAETARLLIERGANLEARSIEGDTPLDSAAKEWWIVEYLAGLLEIEINQEVVTTGRAEITALLESQGARSRSGRLGLPPQAQSLIQFWQLGAMIPALFHLWFLYYLLWLVAGFVLVAGIGSRLRMRPLPSWLIASPTAWLVLFPLTLLPQLFMYQSFGPDTAAGLLPWPPKLFYYALFFGFGALCHGRPEFETEAGRRWPVYLALAFATLVAGVHFFEERMAGAEHAHLPTSICAVLYAWLMIYGCLGLFRHFFSTTSATIRYLSDASYWIYLAHLPLVVALQLLVSRWPLPSLPKFLGICAITYASLLVLYHLIVRHTFIGTMLNGKKTRLPPLPNQPPPLPREDGAA